MRGDAPEVLRFRDLKADLFGGKIGVRHLINLKERLKHQLKEKRLTMRHQTAGQRPSTACGAIWHKAARSDPSVHPSPTRERRTRARRPQVRCK